MRKFRLGLTSLSGLVFVLAVPSAFAGNCGQFGGQNCDPGVVYNSAGVAIADPTYAQHPLFQSRVFMANAARLQA